MVLCTHPMDVDSKVPKLEGVPFLVTRRCGEYTHKGIEHVLGSFNSKRYFSVSYLRI